jgi:predicted Zn-dependent protease
MTQKTGNSEPQVVEGIRHATDLYSKGETELAVQHLLALIAEFPMAASLHGYLAVFLSRRGRVSEAVEHAREATLLSPKSEKGSIVLFQALWKTGQHVEALDEMKRYLALRPSEEYSKMIKGWELTCPGTVTKEHVRNK